MLIVVVPMIYLMPWLANTILPLIFDDPHVVQEVAGAWIGGIMGAAMILSQDPLQAVQFIIFLIILQQIEGHLIYPNVVGQSVGLPSIWVFVAVIAGGSLFGLLGVLLGVPVISTVRTLLMEHFAKMDEEKRTC